MLSRVYHAVIEIDTAWVPILAGEIFRGPFQLKLDEQAADLDRYIKRISSEVFPPWTVADREGKELALVRREQGSLRMRPSKRGGCARG